MIDSREHQAPFIAKRFCAAGIESDIVCFPQETGCDYLIQNTHGSVAIQRKVVCSELLSELDETLHQTLPRLKNFTGDSTPVLLIEENFGIDQSGYLYNRIDHRETSMLAAGYFGYLETIRKSGIEVITTRDLNQSIWWMIATHGYLANEHYPKHRKYHSVKEQAVGMLTAVSGIGEARALKALKQSSIRNMAGLKDVKGLTAKQSEKLTEVLRYKDA